MPKSAKIDVKALPCQRPRPSLQCHISKVLRATPLLFGSFKVHMSTTKPPNNSLLAHLQSEICLWKIGPKSALHEEANWPGWSHFHRGISQKWEKIWPSNLLIRVQKHWGTYEYALGRARIWFISIDMPLAKSPKMRFGQEKKCENLQFWTKKF